MQRRMWVAVAIVAAFLLPIVSTAQLADEDAKKRLLELAQKPVAADEPVAPPIIKYNSPTYRRIPLSCKVGETIQATLLDKALRDAEKRSPSAVILEVDSGGGSTDEVMPLIGAIADHKKNLRIIVWAKTAGSAAAIFSLAADVIYLPTTGTIGAATPYKLSPTGTPEDVDEKFRSTWRAKARGAAEAGHHSPLFAEGMVDASGTIYASKKGDQITLTTTSDDTDDAVVKDADKLMMLTGAEATRWGLSKAVAENIEEVGAAAGFPGWKECDCLGPALMQWRIGRVAAVHKTATDLVQRFLATRTEAMASHPSRFDYAHMGRAEAVRTWKNRCTRCAELLRKAEIELLRLAAIAKEYPQYQFEDFEQYRSQLIADRAGLEAGRESMPEPPKPKPTYGR